MPPDDGRQPLPPLPQLLGEALPLASQDLRDVYDHHHDCPPLEPRGTRSTDLLLRILWLRPLRRPERPAPTLSRGPESVRRLRLAARIPRRRSEERRVGKECRSRWS